MESIEKLLYDFSARIPEIREENYWKRVAMLKMYSQERRMERYRVIYVWKILENYAPNCGVKLAKENPRLGRKCQVPSLLPQGRMSIQTLREQSFQTNGVRLFNSIPKEISEIRIHQDEF